MEENNKEKIQEQAPDTYGMIAGKAVNAKAAAKRLLLFMGRQKKRLLVIFIFILASSGLNIMTPLLSGKVIDKLYHLTPSSGSPFDAVWNAAGSILLVLIITHVITASLRYCLEYIKASLAQKMTLAIRIELNEKLNHLPLSYYDAHKKGEILSRITSDVEKIVDIFEQSVVPLVISGVTLTGAIILMLWISPVLTLIAFVSIFISMWVTSKISAKSYGIFMKNQETLGALGASIQEFYKGRIIVKSFGREEDTIRLVTEASDRQFDASLKAQFITYLLKPVVRLISQLGYVAVAVLGGVYLIQGHLTLGMIQAFIQYMNQSAEPITEASYTINMIQAAFAAAERIFQVLDETEEIPDVQPSKELLKPEGNLTFSHVQFGYEPGTILMNDMNLSVKSGQTVAIVGPTGAGKTTFVNLLMRFYEVRQGNILIDGVDINEMKRSDVRSLLGMVLQDTWLFQGTIKDNISYGCPDASFEQITKAAKLARADYFIRTLPNGYDTELNEEISNISQGQIQLLTIARAVLKDPAILILDEATSSVDTRTEQEIQTAMRNLMKGRTSFVIAHRLSTILDSDLIVVMDQGSITEQGTHEELLEKKGFYYKLFYSQYAVNSDMAM